MIPGFYPVLRTPILPLFVLPDLNATPRPSSSCVAILLCTYQGEHFLPPLLASLQAQTHKNWHLWVSDDGSSDQTLALLNDFARRVGESQITLLKGPRKGAAQNFMSLVHNTTIQADYYAYCDQDDVWNPDRLRRGIQVLEKEEEKEQPLLYGSRTHYIDTQGKTLGYSQAFSRPASFENALVQCIAGGNTMLFNSACRRYLLMHPKDMAVTMHDWWTYLVVTAWRGKVFYDQWPSVAYRQHKGNVQGMNRGFRARFSRFLGLFDGRIQQWNRLHIAAFKPIFLQLPADTQRCLQQFMLACGVNNRTGNLFTRLRAFRQAGIYRQKPQDTLALAMLAAIGRL